MRLPETPPVSSAPNRVRLAFLLAPNRPGPAGERVVRAEALGARFRFAEPDKAFGQIDGDSFSFGPTASAAGKADPPLQQQTSRTVSPSRNPRRSTVCRPKRCQKELTDGKVIRRRVVSRGGFGVRLFQFAHWT